MGMLSRRSFLGSVGVSGAASWVASQTSWAEDAGQPKPNVILILVDDMRFDQMAHEGHPYIRTPNLDRLAREGVRFTNAYVTSPLCGPVRGSIFTGRQPSVHMRRDNAVYTERMEPYLPCFFHEEGYRMAMIGKFYEGKHLVGELKGGLYDRWFQNLGPFWGDYEGDPKDNGARMRFRNERMYYDQMYSVDGKARQMKGHQTDVLFAETARFACEASDKPFFAFLSPFAPHAPCNPSLRRKGRYAGKGIPPRANQEFDKGFFADGKRLDQFRDVHERTCEMIEDIDDGVGVLLDALAKAGRLDDTLIMFTSDNGVLHGEHGFGWKRHAWQESVRIPLLVRYPKVARAGTVCHGLVSLADALVTCAGIAGVRLPDDDRRYGVSVAPLLTGRREQVRDALLTMQYGAGKKDDPDFVPDDLEWASVIAADGWKLVVYRELPSMRPDLGRVFLHNLRADPFEMHNVADDPDHVQRLKSLTETLRTLLVENGAETAWLAG